MRSISPRRGSSRSRSRSPRASGKCSLFSDEEPVYTPYDGDHLEGGIIDTGANDNEPRRRSPFKETATANSNEVSLLGQPPRRDRCKDYDGGTQLFLTSFLC